MGEHTVSGAGWNGYEATVRRAPAAPQGAGAETGLTRRPAPEVAA